MSKPANTTPHRSGNAAPIWVVVADAGRARVMESDGPEGRLTELEDLLNPGARLQEHEAVADRKGRVMQGAAHVGQSFEPHHTQASHEADNFAKEICGKLETARQQKKVSTVYLVADPTFLGMLRKHLEPATRLMIREEIASDLTRMPVADIRKVLPARL